MQFEIDQLDSDPTVFAHTYENDQLSFADTEVNRLISPAAVEGEIRRRRGQVEIRGNLTATVESVCDRCLRPVEIPVKTDFAASYEIESAAEVDAHGARELTTDDLEVGELTGDVFSLDDFVREQILINLPGRILCREDCAGLCAQCGADLNEGACGCLQKEIDPRWAGLAALHDAGGE